MLGIDVGFSLIRRSSAVCRLDWDAHRIAWTICRFRAFPAEQESIIGAVAADKLLQAAAFDGPLQAGFEVIGRYRTAERVLTHFSLASRIGKPGQSNAPVGNQPERGSKRLCQGRPTPMPDWPGLTRGPDRRQGCCGGVSEQFSRFDVEGSRCRCCTARRSIGQILRTSFRSRHSGALARLPPARPRNHASAKRYNKPR